MKSNISSHDRLLIHLASRGDPTAFYTLASPYLRNMYIKSRSEGALHNDICLKLSSQVKNLFRKVGSAKPESFDEWFRKHASYSDLSPEVTANEEMVEAECLSFLQDIQNYLLKCRRNAKQFKEAKSGIFTRNTFFLATLLLLALLVCGSGYFYMIYSGSNLRIEYKTPRKVHVFSVPVRTEADTAAADLSVLSPAPESIDTSVNSRNLGDTIEPKPVPPKKRVAKLTRHIETPATMPSPELRVTDSIPAQPGITAGNSLEPKDTASENQ